MIKAKLSTIRQNLITNKFIYPKPILRYKTKKMIGKLDYSFKIFNLNLKKIKNFKIGQNNYYSLKQLTHKVNSSLKVTTPINFQILKKPYEISSKITKLTKNLSKAKFNGFIKLLNPIKGGYYAYYSGLHGLIPKKQLKPIISQSIPLTYTNLSTNLYFSKLHNKNTLLKPYMIIKAIKIKLLPKVKIITLPNLKKQKTWKTKIKFIFLSKKKENNNEKYKTNNGKYKKNKTNS